MTAETFLAKVREAGVLPPAHVPKAGEAVSKYLTAGVDHVVSPDTGEVWLHPPLLLLFDKSREGYARPKRVTAGSRTIPHEAALQRAGYKTAKFVSPHCLSAVDCHARAYAGVSEQQDNQHWIAAVRSAAQELKLPPPRLGFMGYGNTFTHVDLVFLFFEPFTTLAHPDTWAELTGEQRALVHKWHPGVEW